MAFYDNFISLCAEKDVSPSGVAREIGLSNAAANGWKKGKKPSDVTLEKLSQYFGVPVSDLTGEGQQKNPPPGGDGLDDKFQEIRVETADFTPAEFNLLLERIKKIKESRV